MKIIYGKGFNDKKYPSNSKAYRVWIDMLRRCYDESSHNLPRFASYQKCKVCDDWLSFSNFYEWAQLQKGLNSEDFCLDKDLLVNNNNVYSPSSCCFIPRELNMALTLRNNHRGNYPLGIHGVERSSRNGEILSYRVKVLRGELSTIRKNFKNIEDAEIFYKESKESHIRYLAEKYKDQIDEKVYVRLLEYKI